MNGRTPSIERGRQSPAPSAGGVGGAGGAGSEAAGEGGGGGGGRRVRKRKSSRRLRHGDTAPPTPHPPGSTAAPTSTNWREEILESKKTHDK